jgi:hypothetical protein
MTLAQSFGSPSVSLSPPAVGGVQVIFQVVIGVKMK